MRILHSPRNVIETDTLRATKTLPDRVRAFSRSDAGIGAVVALAWDDMLSGKQNHDRAATTFASKRGWVIDLIGYQIFTGYIYVNAAPDPKARAAAAALIDTTPRRKVPLRIEDPKNPGTYITVKPSA
jgi:hypothetical protein